jgi:regulator of nonsense transcripts 1
VQLFQLPDWSCEMAKDNDDEESNPGSQEDDNKQKVKHDDDDADDDNDDEEGEDEDVSDVSNEDDSLTEDEENGEHLYTLDHYDEEKLPEYSCRYCGIHDPACVAKCVETKKWFCNAVLGSGGSHLVHHLVRSRSNQVQLHPESPLGDTVLECYNCASKNAFVLGFVPASSSSVVVLLCRVCVETVPALKDMDWELAQWHPLIQDRKFLPWLIKVRCMFPAVIKIGIRFAQSLLF